MPYIQSNKRIDIKNKTKTITKKLTAIVLSAKFGTEQQNSPRTSTVRTKNPPQIFRQPKLQHRETQQERERERWGREMGEREGFKEKFINH
jgi:uncharacterized membrane protein YagU involved in acid resistance